MTEPSQPPVPARASRGRRASLAVIFFTVLLDLLGFGMILPLLPFYALDFGASPAGVTLLFASYSLAQFVFAPLWGRLSDRVGRRPVLLGSIAGAAVAYVVFAFAPSFSVLLAARIASGIAAANYSIAQAWIADVTPPAQRARGMGFLGAAFGLGFVLGPVLGALVGAVDYRALGLAGLLDPLATGGPEALGYRAVALAAATLSLANLILAWRLVPESLGARDRTTSDRWLSFTSFRQAFGHPSLAGLMVLFFAVVFAFSGMESTLGLYVERPDGFGFDFQATAWLFTFIGVVLATVQGGLLGPLVRRFGERKLVVAGVASMTLGLLLLPLADSVVSLGATTALLAIGMGLHNPSTLALISRRTDAGDQGGVLGVARSLGALARGVGPLLGGAAFQELGPAWPFWSAGAMMIACLLYAVTLFGRTSPVAPGTEPEAC